MSSHEVRRRVEAWFDSVEPLIDVRRPQTEHLDVLLGPTYRRSNALTIGLTALVELIEVIAHREKHLMAILVIPLEPLATLDVSVPRRAEFEAQVTDEPPGLYVVRRESGTFWQPDEEFRVPLSFDALELRGSKGQVKAYYRCFRTADGQRFDWEYERCIYFEHYPDELISSQV